MPKQRTPIPLNLGLWNRRNSLAQPLGALKHARDAIIDEDTGSLRKRRAKVDLDGSAIGVTGRGITQLQSRDGTVDKLAVHAGGTLYTADTSENPTFASHDTGIGDTGPTTFLVYNDNLFTSDGTTTRVTNATTARQVGIPAGDTTPGVTKVVGQALGFTVGAGHHFAWRYYDSTNKVASELSNVNNQVASATTGGEISSGETIDGYDILGLPTSAPSDTSVDKVQLFMTKSEAVPATFYLISEVAIGSGPTYRPTANANVTGSANVTGPASSYDGSKNTAGYFFLDSRTALPAADIEHRFTDIPSETRADWQISVTYSANIATGNTATAGTIEYTTNAWVGSTTIATLTATEETTVTADVSGSTDSDDIQLRINLNRPASAGTGEYQFITIQDIRLSAAGVGSGEVSVRTAPTGNEEFVNAGNIGHFQQAPGRVFPATFEEHALGVNKTNGLFLSYSETNKPESWSTSTALALFPNLIPFSEKEADDITGAEKVANQLVVMATDSVWRINHLPVVSDPSGATSTIFAEARSTVKRRVTDVVGCAGVKAYTRCQLNSDEDFVFFWSKRGPRLTDGFRVWQPADHVDWTHLSFDQSETVVRNFTFKERIYAVVRTTDASASDVAYVFHYDADSLAEMQKLAPGQLRFKVTGPHDPMTIADLTEVKLGSGEKILTGISNVTTGAEQGQTYVIERGAAGATDADDSTAPSFEWNTERIGSPGRTGHFDKVLFNVQEDANRTVTVGDTTTTPLLPVDKDAVEIGKAGQSLELAWDDDAVQSYVNADDEYENPANASPQSVSFTKPDRIINTATLFWDDGEESRD